MLYTPFKLNRSSESWENSEKLYYKVNSLCNSLKNYEQFLEHSTESGRIYI